MKSKLEVLPRQRDLRLDSLRGLFLVLMTINHLPTEMRVLTDQPIGLFSAAEGFVFLSGLLAGWVYTRKRRELGPAGLRAAAEARANTIYRWHIASFVAAFVLVRISAAMLGYCSPNVPRLFFEHPLGALGLGATLLYQPGLLDLLPMYCAFVLVLPQALRAMEAGRKRVVLAISAGLWLAVQWSPPVDGAPLYPINTGSFNLLAWQFLFIAGVAIGHARISGREQVSRPSPWALAGASAVVIYGIGVRYGGWGSLWPSHAYGILLNKPDLGLLRMGDFGAAAYLVSVLGARFPWALSWRPLALLGRHSLAVVAVQSVAVMVCLQFPDLFATEFLRTATAAALLALLFGASAALEKFPPASSARTGPPIGTRQAPAGRLVRPDDARAA